MASLGGHGVEVPAVDDVVVVLGIAVLLAPTGGELLPLGTTKRVEGERARLEKVTAGDRSLPSPTATTRLDPPAHPKPASPRLSHRERERETPSPRRGKPHLPAHARRP